jgi:hypothetical protein
MQITFNTAENKIVVTFEDGTIKEYVAADAEQYFADYPDRASDLVAMGWK